jgi:hypothetical protein
MTPTQDLSPYRNVMGIFGLKKEKLGNTSD